MKAAAVRRENKLGWRGVVAGLVVAGAATVSAGDAYAIDYTVANYAMIGADNKTTAETNLPLALTSIFNIPPDVILDVNITNSDRIAIGAGKTVWYSGALNGAGGLTLGQFSGSGTLIKAGAGDITLGHPNNPGFGLTLVLANKCTLTVGNNQALGTGSLTIAASGVIVARDTILPGETRLFSNEIDLGVNNLAIENTLKGTNSAFILSGAIGGKADGNELTIQGGGTIVLSGANTYGGDTMLKVGTTLSINNNAALGGNTGKLKIEGEGTTLENWIHGDKARAIVNDIHLNGYELKINNDDTTKDFTLSGTISNGYDGAGVGSNSKLLKTGLGTIVLSGKDSTFRGGTTIQTGTILVGSANALGKGIVTDNTVGRDDDGLQFQDGTNAVTIGGLAGKGDIKLEDEKAAAVALTVGNELNLDSTYEGILSGTGSLIKDGKGTFTLAGENTYEGDTKITNGTLEVTGTIGDNKLLENVGDYKGAITIGPTAADVAAKLLINNAKDGEQTLSGVISGFGSLEKAGDGTLILTGVNIYTGKTVINGGTLSISDDANLGAMGALTVKNQLTLNGGTLLGTANLVLDAKRGVTLGVGGGTLVAANKTTMTVAGIITGAGGLTINDAKNDGIVNLTGNNTYTGDTTITQGTLEVSGTLGDDKTNRGIGTYAGNIVITNATDKLIFSNNTLNGEQTISGDITGKGSLEKIGQGTLVLAGMDNTYAGDTKVHAGTLQIAGKLTTAGNVVIGNVATLGVKVDVVNGPTLTANTVDFNHIGKLDISGYAGTGSSGVVIATANGVLNFSNVITVAEQSKVDFLTATAAVVNGGKDVEVTMGLTWYSTDPGYKAHGTFTLNPASSTFTVDAVLADNFVNNDPLWTGKTLTKEGAGTLILNGANTYTGGTTINAGTIEVGHNTALGKSDVTLGGAATIGKTATSGAITIANTVYTTGNVLTLNNADTKNAFTLTGGIRGTGDLVKTGSGAVVLGGSTANTFADVLVRAGVLANASSNIFTANNITITGPDSMLMLSAMSQNVIGGAILVETGGTIEVANGADFTGSVITDFTLNDGTLKLSGTDTMNTPLGDITLGTYGGNVDVADDLTATHNGIISGAGSLTKTGDGTLVLTSANTYTGRTAVNGGTLSISAENNLGITPFSTVADQLALNGGTLLVTETFALDAKRGVTLGAAGGTLAAANAKTMTVAGIVTGTGALEINDADNDGTVVLNGNNTYTGGTTINAGTVEVGHKNAFGTAGVTLTGDATIGKTAASGALTIANAINAAGNNLTLNNASAANALTFTGGITGGGDLEKTGDGTVVLGGTNNNTFADVVVSAGVLTNASSGTFTAKNITVTGDGVGVSSTLKLGATSTNAITGTILVDQKGTIEFVNGAQFVGAGPTGLTLDDGTLKLSGTGTMNMPPVTVTLGANGGTVDVANNLTATHSGTFIGNSGAKSSLTKTGDGTLALAGVNTYAGATTINAGTLALTGAGSILNSSGVNLAVANTEFDISGITAVGTTIKGLSGVAATTVELGDKNLTVNSTTNSAFAGVISGAGTFTKTGAGILTLSGDSSAFTGTFAQTGGSKVTLAAATKIGGTYTQAAGTTLTTNGAATLGNATFAGIITLGGKLDVTSATFNNATLNIGTLGANQIVATDTANIVGGVTINLGDITAMGDGNYTLINATTFTGTAANATVTASGKRGGHYVDTKNADLVYTIFSGPANLTWAGTTLNNTWNTTPANTNWANGAITTYFLNNDSVTFAADGANKNVVVDAGGVTVGTMAIKDSYNFTGGAITATGAVTVDAGKTLGLVASNNTALTAKSINFNGSALNITGYTPNEVSPYNAPKNVQTVITTTNGITNLDTANITVAGQAKADFLSASATLSGNDLRVETRLTWYSTDPSRPAHGTFTINPAASAFELGAILADTAPNPTTGWDGKTLTKAGAGTLILTAANTYSGGTTISTGTLQIGNNGATGSIVGDVLNNGTLAFNRTDAVTFGGLISGSGSVVKNSAGTLTLTANNTYAGTTTVNAGTLSVATAANVGTGKFTLAGGTLQVTGAMFNKDITLGAGGGTISNGGNVSIANVISGTSLTKVGAGKLTLSGVNTYTGETKIAVGTLALSGNGSVAASSKVNLTTAGVKFDISGVTSTLPIVGTTINALDGVAGTEVVLGQNGLAVVGATNSSFAGVISGNGGIIKTGTGDLALSGANTYSGGTGLAGGQITIGNNSALGTGNLTIGGANTVLAKDGGADERSIANNIALGANTLTVSNTNIMNAFKLTGNITGIGGIKKTGASTVILSGENIYTGATTVEGGTLDLASKNFTATGNVVVQGTGNLSISGKLTLDTGKLVIQDAMGATVKNGGVLVVTAVAEADKANAPLSIGNGVFTVDNGGELQVLIDCSKLPIAINATEKFYFATEGGTFNNFGKVTFPVFPKLYEPVYAGGVDRFISVKRKSASSVFPLISKSVADSLDKYDLGCANPNTFINTLLTDTVSGSEHVEFAYNAAGVGGVAVHALQASQTMMGAIQRHYTDQSMIPSMMGNGQDGEVTRGQSLWAMPIISHLDANGIRSGGLNYSVASDQYGCLIGYESAEGRNRWGVAGLLGGGQTVTPGAGTRTNTSSFIGGVGIYSTVAGSWFDTNSQLSWVGSDNKLTQRQAADRLDAKIGGGAFFFGFGFERPKRSSQFYFTPTAGLEYTCVYQQEFKTTATPLAGGATTDAFNAGGGSGHLLTFPLGFKGSYTWNHGRFGSLVPDAAVRIVPNVGDHWLYYNNTPTGAPAAEVRSAIGDRMAADANMGMMWRYGRLEAGVRYTGLFSERFTNHNAGFLVRREW